MARSDRERLPVSKRLWHCDPNAIICELGDHLLAFYESGYRADMTRLSGHMFAKCAQCAPHCHMLLVFSPLPSPIVYCYRLSGESYTEWDRSQEPTPPTSELLYRVRDPDGRSFNPYWRPPSTTHR